MNSKMVRVHIDKKAFISSGFSCSNNFGTIRTWTSVIWSLIGWWFGPSSFRQIHSFIFHSKNCPNQLGPNHRPISDQIIEVQVLIVPKLLLHENLLEINAFLPIWTRTIFEFICSLTCRSVKYLYFCKFFLWLTDEKTVASRSMGLDFDRLTLSLSRNS